MATDTPTPTSTDNPLAGAAHFFRGFRLMVQPGVRKWMVIPLLLNILVFAGGIAAGAAGFAELVAWVQEATPGWLDWLAWLLWPLFVVAALLVVFYAFTLVAALVAAPFVGPLAAAVEVHLTGRAPEDGEGSALAIARGALADIGAEVRKLGYFAVRAIPLLVLFVIPVLNVLAPVAWFLFGAWGLAQEYLDAPLGNRGLRFPEQRPVLGRRRWTVLGFGTAAAVATAIPLVNFLVLPAAVAGATSLAVARLPREG
ncbi:sulfate transporter CysZ [Thiohalospira sp.]|uniref:sulfate transporter CysZ n=1 Tax=Thiohalospira sp. TaxID=3080549 RepID=UPI00398093B3